MEIFITGDTHGDFRRFRPDIFYEQEHMTKEPNLEQSSDCMKMDDRRGR